ncbi:LamG-like jellyroll fold domain-containing protein [Nocardia sp. NPDC101769]|uniref:LamG-like jellyroll fold domain-containing protein n=1 Tax=Nocardia sp. NPDC101769 TaxID=3364333 RepID=UPI00380AB4C6
MQNKNLQKIYSDKTYVWTTMVQHAGMVVAFAVGFDLKIYYSVLSLDQADRAKGALDAAAWNDEPGVLPFPGEIVEVGAESRASLAIPAVKKRGGAEVTVAETLVAGEGDPFLSTTARLTSPWPIQVLSDGRYILMFRQSIPAGDPNSLYVREGGGLSGDPARTDYQLVGGQKVAQVDNSLLCDRFVLVGSELKPVVEVRYQRSRSRITPASGGDTLGSRDMEGKLFYEPTLQLSFVGRLEKGMFSALLLPTAVSGLSRWQIFTSAADYIYSYNLEQGTDGLFNVKGTQLYTSPDPKYAGSVLERAPGIDFNTGRPLVPVVPGPGEQGGAALRFEGAASGPVIAGNAMLDVPAGPYTMEAWIKPGGPDGLIMGRTDKTNFATPVLLRMAGGNLIYGHGTDSLVHTTPLPLDTWSHVAAVFDGTSMRLFLNGIQVQTRDTTATVAVTGQLMVGKRLATGTVQPLPFTGVIDEVRIWTLARTDFSTRAQRLLGNEPGLFAYLPFDEGAGNTLRDAGPHHFPASRGPSPVWVDSDAPLYDGPGMSLRLFALAGRTVKSGLAATMYHQQQPMVTGYAITPSLEKRRARVLLAFATGGLPPQGEPDGRSYLAVLDFGVSPQGRLATAPGLMDPTWIGKPDPTADLERLRQAEALVTTARGQLAIDQGKAALLGTYTQLLEETNGKMYGGVWGSTVNDRSKILGPAGDWARGEMTRLLAVAARWEGLKADSAAAADRVGVDSVVLTLAQANLAGLSGGMQGAAEAVLAMPTIGIDRSGLSVLGALLSFAWTDEKPFLLDSSTGEVALYFRGGSNQFFSVYYDTTVAPAVKQIPVADGTLRLTGRDPSIAIGLFTATVSAVNAGTCTVTLTRGEVTETFTAVPTRADLLAKVLNGALPGTEVGTVVSIKDTTVMLAAPLANRLVAGSAVTVGEQSRTVADAPAGSTQLTLTTGGLTAPAGAKVRAVAYDYSLASSSVAGALLTRGSQLVRADAGTAIADVPACAAETLSDPLPPCWRGNAPGRAFSFDGTQYLQPADLGKLAGLAATGDLTLEAWAYPTFVGNYARILHAELADTRYSLGVAAAPQASGQPGYVILGEVNDQRVFGTEVFPLSEWAQLSMSFRQDWAMGMDGSGYLDAGGPAGLDIVDDLTLEVSVRLNSATGSVQGLIGKGAIDAGDHQAVPYSLYIDTNGQLAFSFEAGSGGSGEQKIFRSGVALAPGAFHLVAVTRRNPTAPGGKVEIRMYVDSQTPVAVHSYNGSKPIGNDSPVELGRVRTGKQTQGLNGVLSEVRIWNIARNDNQIGVPVTEKVSGLAAWWNFPEATGNQTADRCGSYPATLHAVSRVRTPSFFANQFTLYRNGIPTPATMGRRTDSAPGLPFSMIGGRWAGANVVDMFTGDLDEVRVWRTARTQEQILDNMFARVHGDREDLIAYYPFDIDDTAAGAMVRDRGLGGNDLTQSSPAPAIRLSTAPISTDAAQVRSALTGISTPFQVSIHGSPAATEYGDVQQTMYGTIFGVMKRAYSYLQNGQWVLTTGYKIGELTTNWVGQVQFDPQLIGYIEGAPPVPSENLIAGTAGDYASASSVTFVQADNVVNALSSTKTHSVDASVKAKFDVSVKDETFTIAAPLGVGIAKPAGSLSFGHGASAEFKYANGWAWETRVSQGTNTTRSSKVELTGGWEDPANLVNANVGRRWVPANTGFAVVQSDTADLYALRLAHSGALVAYRVLPSSDIPRDWNLIPFPINPRYTKQGTLDGIIGYAPIGSGTDLAPFADPNFPNAANGMRGEFSYYRPGEAYRIKRRIQREQQQLQSFYDSVSTETHVPDPTHGQAAKVLNGMMGGTGAEVSPKDDPEKGRAATRSASRRNIINTYVWTAAGGFFAETTGTTDQVTETTTGSYSITASLGGSFSMGFEIFGAGATFALEASVGTGYSITRTKSKDATRTFSLDVACAPGRQLQQFQGDTPLFDAAGRPALVPGRVDAYRFMSFYLDTTTDNFEDFYGKVIDPEWLDRGTDPNALALRAARQSTRKPPCWRIMHRVTFVSRVLPTTPPARASLTQAMTLQQIPSTFALIKRLEPFLGTATANGAELATKTRDVITTRFPVFIPYINEITALLTGYYQSTMTGITFAPPIPVPPSPIPARAQFVAGHVDKLLDVGGATLANGAQVDIAASANADQQKFTLIPLDNGYYAIIAKHSGKAITVAGTFESAPAQQSDWIAADNQKFRFEPKGNGYGIIDMNTGKALTVYSGIYDDGTPVQVWEWGGAAHQTWQIRPLTDTTW